MPDPQSTDPRQQALSHLVAIGLIDTLYFDHYFQRLQAFLQTQLPPEEYRRLLKERQRLAFLPNHIRNALNDGDWGKVRDLSKEYELVKTGLDRQGELLKLAQSVYEQHDPPIDPFSPGMNTIPGVSKKGLNELRTEAKLHLGALASIDPQWREFYLGRRQAFEQLSADVGSGRSLGPSIRQLESEALEALDEGNYGKLARLADDLRTLPGSTPEAAALDIGNTSAPPDFDFAFSAATLSRAQALGLERQRAESQHRKLAPLCKFAWHPNFAPATENHNDVIPVSGQTLPGDIPEALKSRVQMFATHPMINSGGVRFLPTLVGEDVLVEAFPEPQRGNDAPGSMLLQLLGLPRRHRLNRQEIEAALLTHGSRILGDELGLDPFAFKLICIPPDLHLRLGQQNGWGQQKIWTHFDGYLVAMDGTLRPLAGGDVRYGGIYDLLGLSRHYASEQTIVRFAVVQRRRMAIWQ